ncbi:MAG: tetratricopeptide repeat protein [Niabella sp.]
MRLFLTILFSAVVLFSLAQSQQSFIKEGNAFFKKGQLNEAVKSYDKVTEEKYKYTALLNKGTALYKQKKLDEAVEAYRQVSSSATAAAALRSGAYYNTGVVYSNQNKIEESIEEYKNALRLNSQDNNARENLQKALSELKKSGGGGGEEKPQPSQSKLNKNQAQQQLDRLEQKERNTQSKMSNKKTQFGGSVGKDW